MAGSSRALRVALCLAAAVLVVSAGAALVILNQFEPAQDAPLVRALVAVGMAGGLAGLGLAAVESRRRYLSLSRAHSRVIDSEARYRQLAEAGPAFVFAADAAGSWTYVSPAFCGLSRGDIDRAHGMGWLDCVHPDERGPVLTAWQTSVAEGSGFAAVARLRGQDGSYRWHELRAGASAERPAGRRWVGVAYDIHALHLAASERATLLQREQRARGEAEAASRLKDDFLATVSHELRTPLNAIVGWVHLLKTGALPDADHHRAIDAIERNCRSQARLVEELLDVSRMVQGRVAMGSAPLDLRDAVGAALETLQSAERARQMTVDRRFDEEPVMVLGDAARLQQVAYNLVANAIKFSPKGGRVEVEVVRAGSRALMRVRDVGEGIEPSLLPHIFDPFRQGRGRTMRSGLGLGLVIVRQIVELHGGSVTAESPGAGHGATFIVTVPLTDEARRRAERADVDLARLAGARVLVAEDDVDSAAAVTAILEHRGCEVKTVATAAEALRVLEGWEPDVIVCDIGLPDDDGYSLLRRIRAGGGAAGRHGAIALTAYAQAEDRARALAAGFRAHLVKPLDPELLAREVAGALGQHRSSV